MRQIIENKRYDEERALYHLQDSQVMHCAFEGPADGESALKESRNITVRECERICILDSMIQSPEFGWKTA